MYPSYLKIILLLPLVPFVFSLFFINNEKYAERYSEAPKIIFLFFTLLCFLGSSFFLINISEIGELNVKLFNWSFFDEFNVNIEFIIDQMSSVFSFLITGIISFITLYLVGMRGSGLGKYMAYFSLLLFFMQLTVFSANTIVFILAWSGVGFITYFLSMFHCERREHVGSDEGPDLDSTLIIANSIGDLCLLLGCIGFIIELDVISFQDIKKLATLPLEVEKDISIACLFIVVGIFSKAIWPKRLLNLPTSFLILIGSGLPFSLGILFLSRLSFIFHSQEGVQNLLIVMGLGMAIGGALVAITKRTIKEILMFSTLSHLGFVVIMYGIQFYDSAIFYTLTHSFIKASLLMAGCAVFHHIKGREDIFFMANIRKSFPIIFGVFLISGLNSLFAPYEILQIFYSKHPDSNVILLLLLLALALTVFYMARLVFSLFFTFFTDRLDADADADTGSSDVSPSPLPMVIAFVSITFIGPMLFFVGLPGPSPSPLVSNKTLILLNSIVFMVSVGLSYFIYVMREKRNLADNMKFLFYGLWSLINDGFRIGKLFNYVILRPVYWIRVPFFLFLEKYIISGLVDVVSSMVYQIGLFFKEKDSDDIQGNILYIIWGTTMVVIFIFNSFIY